MPPSVFSCYVLEIAHQRKRNLAKLGVKKRSKKKKKKHKINKKNKKKKEFQILPQFNVLVCENNIKIVE